MLVTDLYVEREYLADYRIGAIDKLDRTKWDHFSVIETVLTILVIQPVSEKLAEWNFPCLRRMKTTVQEHHEWITTPWHRSDGKKQWCDKSGLCTHDSA